MSGQLFDKKTTQKLLNSTQRESQSARNLKVSEVMRWFRAVTVIIKLSARTWVRVLPTTSGVFLLNMISPLSNQTPMSTAMPALCLTHKSQKVRKNDKDHLPKRK